MTTPPLLLMDGVHFTHPGGRAQLIDVGLHALPGEIVCLLGPNGAGKTTLLRLLLGLLTGSSGTVHFEGRPLDALSSRERARLVAYVPQTVSTAFPFTALDMAVMGRTPHIGVMRTPSAADRAAARSVLSDLGIEHLADQAFASLSGGERALTLMARAVVQEARMLVLDEPTAALDLGNAARVLTVVRDLARQGRSVVMTTHHPDQALRDAHRAVLMRAGRVVAQGTPGEVLTSARLSEVYGTPVAVGDLAVPGRDEPLPVCVPYGTTGDMPADPAHLDDSAGPERRARSADPA